MTAREIEGMDLQTFRPQLLNKLAFELFVLAPPLIYLTHPLFNGVHPPLQQRKPVSILNGCLRDAGLPIRSGRRV